MCQAKVGTGWLLVATKIPHPLLQTLRNCGFQGYRHGFGARHCHCGRLLPEFVQGRAEVEKIGTGYSNNGNHREDLWLWSPLAERV